ncbi:AAA family ATPase [Microbacterium sp. KSW2-21]|uniref:Nuclease SbcCD subunit C n=1 Tax=Microbacterium algihabitans TaxID=3075992 RepID=A0ABU3RTS5_9MICO|nr:AAA family ATPase [Microbacterium sp. KSW2-21]MDU0326311.1 AAA family ATPase [Microbacterium sp. KSW2-21]
MTELRLQELVVENFRSIAGRCVIPLDGSITLIHGANGAGKTSLLSAIELGATGSVGFLDEQTGDARSLLRNHDFPLGHVRLALEDRDDGTRVGSFELNGDTVSGRAALTKPEQTYFLERSFLPQTALGRLLESYTETGKQVDTALVRFVKSLVGLDELDALIDGLHASGDLRRSRKAVPSWARAKDRVDALQTRRRELQIQHEKALTMLAEAAARLRDLLGETSTDYAIDELLRTAIDRGRGVETSRAELSELEQFQAKVDAVGNLVRSSLFNESAETAQDLARDLEARTALEAWEAGSGAALLAELNAIRHEFLALPAAEAAQLADVYEQTVTHAIAAANDRAEAIASNDAKYEQISLLDRRIADIDHAIASGEKRVQLTGVSDDIRTLIEILNLAIPVLESERCPLCDQHFQGPGSLSEHLNSKLGRLSAGAREVVHLERELASLRAERLTAVRQVVLLKSVPAQDVIGPLDEAIRRLNAMADSVNEGSRLLQIVQSAQARAAEILAWQAERAVIADRIADVRSALGLSFPDSSFEDSIAVLKEEIGERIQRLRFADIQRRREREAREAIEDAQRDAERSEKEVRDADAAISRLQAQMSTADSRMMSARDVLQHAEMTRSQLINEVFDQSLNALWAQLFTRFAPSERFTPRFVKQTAASRSVDVRLETELPDGRISGSPGAMLSYGNTNSAALALFMALHLSAPPELPWIIFDDPVQSMDDIHVANFATIVRQLAFVHGRQVVIAVHQPELFDYLALELAPSARAHSLVRVTLDRGSGLTVADVERVSYAKEPSLHRAIS